MFDLSLQELEYVAALADERNFTRTARRVHMAQPALSQAIKRIERRLGVRLFDRTSRRVIPTVAGEVLAAEAVRIHGSVHQAVRRTRQAAGQPEHMRVHVSEPSLTTPRQILAAIRAHVPRAAVNQTTLPQVVVRDQLLSGGLSFSIAGRIFGPGLEEVHLRDESVGVLVSRQHSLADAEQVTLEDVAPYPLLSVDEAMSGWNRWVGRLFEDHNHQAQWTEESIFGVENAMDILEDDTTVLLTLESVSKEHLDRVAWVPLDPSRTVPWYLTWERNCAGGSESMVAAIQIATRVAEGRGWTRGVADFERRQA